MKTFIKFSAIKLPAGSIPLDPTLFPFTLPKYDKTYHGQGGFGHGNGRENPCRPKTQLIGEQPCQWDLEAPETEQVNDRGSTRIPRPVECACKNHPHTIKHIAQTYNS